MNEYALCLIWFITPCKFQKCYELLPPDYERTAFRAYCRRIYYERECARTGALVQYVGCINIAS